MTNIAIQKAVNHELTNKTKWEKTGISLMREKNPALSVKPWFTYNIIACHQI